MTQPDNHSKSLKALGKADDAIAMLFDYRQEADYDLDEDITQEEAEILVEKAEEFYLLAKAYFLEY